MWVVTICGVRVTKCMRLCKYQCMRYVHQKFSCLCMRLCEYQRIRYVHQNQSYTNIVSKFHHLTTTKHYREGGRDIFLLFFWCAQCMDMNLSGCCVFCMGKVCICMKVINNNINYKLMFLDIFCSFNVFLYKLVKQMDQYICET